MKKVKWSKNEDPDMFSTSLYFPLLGTLVDAGPDEVVVVGVWVAEVELQVLVAEVVRQAGFLLEYRVNWRDKE